MNNRAILAAATVASLAATSAFALDPRSNTPTYTIYAAGGSSENSAVTWAATQLLTNADIITDGACGKPSANYVIVFGNPTSAFITEAANPINGENAFTLNSTDNVLLVYRATGGAVPNGIAPFGKGTAVSYPSPTAISGVSACSSGALPNPTYQLASGFGTTSQVPDWGTGGGFEPAIYTKYNSPGTYTPSSGLATRFTPGTPLTPLQASNFTSVATYDEIWAAAVTNNLYTGSFGGGALHPKTNFTKPELAAILTGQYTNWSQLRADDSTQLPAGPIVLVHRAPGVSTEAGTNQYFLNYPGSSGQGGSLLPNNVTLLAGGVYNVASGATISNPCTLTTSGYVDINESSIGGVASDLNNANLNGCRALAFIGAEYPPAKNTPAAGTTGAGVMQYSFVTINGVGIDDGSGGGINSTGSTNYANALNGSYDYFFTDGFQYRNAFVTGGGAVQHYFGDGTAYATFIQVFLWQLQQPNLPGAVNSAGVHGVILDPNVLTGLGVSLPAQCTALTTRYGNSTAPEQLFGDANTALATACVDPLH